VIDKLLALVRRLLSGEPLRMIAYGAVLVVWVVTRLAVSLGYATQAPDLDTILLAVSAAVAAVTEAARRFVYSPATVERIAPPMVNSAIPGPGNLPEA